MKILAFACILMVQNFLNLGVTGQVESQGTPYVIQQGDTLKQIARRFCGSENLWTQIRDFNNIQGDVIFAGSTLLLPPICTEIDDTVQPLDTQQQTPQQDIEPAAIPDRVGESPLPADDIQPGREDVIPGRVEEIPSSVPGVFAPVPSGTGAMGGATR
jgi:LysM repeat protein